MITSVFGISIKYEAWNQQDSLPVYITGSYNFRTAYIGNKRCIILIPTEELVTLPALKKQITKIQQVDNVPVVFELAAISNYRRKSFIENNIPFITDKQVFLPFIGTMLMNEKEPVKQIEKFVYSTQQLFLSYLYGKEKRLYIAEAGKMLPFTAMTLTSLKQRTCFWWQKMVSISLLSQNMTDMNCLKKQKCICLHLYAEQDI